jgi:hypothetical protein
MITPRQQYYSFEVAPHQRVEHVFQTKYKHDKVVGVVLLPSRNVYGDTIYLEINRQIVLPHGFNAGLISYQQFLNDKISDNTYLFEEEARGSTVRVIYNNNDSRFAKIDLLLYTCIGDREPIIKRKRLQIIPVTYSENRFNIRARTNYYYDELLGLFIDYHTVRNMLPNKDFVESDFGKILAEFLDKIEQWNSLTISNVMLKTELVGYFGGIDFENNQVLHDTDERWAVEAMEKVADEVANDSQQIIDALMFDRLQDMVRSRLVYYDAYQTESTFGLSIDTKPIYPDNYPIAKITPRYRKSFNKTMCICNMQVKEADVHLRFQKIVNDSKIDIAIQPKFNMYLMFNQTVNKKI